MAAKLLDSVADAGQIAIIHIDENYKNAVHMQEKKEVLDPILKRKRKFIT